MADPQSTPPASNTAPGWESDTRNSSFMMVYEDVWQALLKDPEALATYMALLRRTHPGNRTWYATKTAMSEEAGVSLSTFERRIDVLVEHGLVRVTHQYRNPANGEISRIKTDDFRQQIQNIYTVSEHTSGWYEQIAKSSNLTSPPSEATLPQGEVGQPHAEVGVTSDRGANIDPLHITQTHIPNTPPAPQGEREGFLAEFEQWYSLYPRKQSRGAAERAFKKARKGTDLPTLIAGLKASIAQWTTERRTRDKIPYPATWLNGKSWLDEIPGGTSAKATPRSGRDWSSFELSFSDFEGGDSNERPF